MPQLIIYTKFCHDNFSNRIFLKEPEFDRTVCVTTICYSFPI